LSGKFSFSFDYDDKWPIKPKKKKFHVKFLMMCASFV
jgi:hypothetical protein